MFSIEYFFRECNLHNHCIGVALKGDEYPTVFVLKVRCSDKAFEECLKRVLLGKDTYGKFIVKAYLIGETLSDSREIELDTNKIDYIEEIL